MFLKIIANNYQVHLHFKYAVVFTCTSAQKGKCAIIDANHQDLVYVIHVLRNHKRALSLSLFLSLSLSLSLSRIFANPITVKKEPRLNYHHIASDF